jgi:hypothetical protein
MKRSILLALILFGEISSWAGPASAQFYPGYGNGGWGGWNGSAALLGSDYKQAQAMQLKAESRQAGQEASMNQNYVVQSGIRNTLSSGAQSRSAAILSQQQATQDWWFQHQSQQMARQQSTDFTMAAMPVTTRSGFSPFGSPAPVATDIIPWPALLQEQCFASERTKIEAPYRRTPPKLSTPTEADYQQMVSTVEDMKAVLQWRLSEGVDTNEYNAAKTFLNQLGSELGQRVQAASR